MHAPDLSYFTPTCVDDKGTFEILYDKGRQLRFDTPRARFITPEPFEPAATVEWLWTDRIPLGRVTVIEGPAGAQKTFLTSYLAATVTRGGPWGDGPAVGWAVPTGIVHNQSNGSQSGVPTGNTDSGGQSPPYTVSSGESHPVSTEKMSQSPVSGPAGEVLYFCSERESADVVAPRMTRMGADVLRVIFRSEVDMVDRLKGPVGTRTMEFPQDLNMLEYDLKSSPGVRLVVIDPLRDFCATPRLMRKALAILDNLAAKYKVAIVVTIQADVKFTPEGTIRHIPRTWDEAARYVWCVTCDPCDPELRRFEPKRTTFCREPQGVAFRVSETGAVTWEPLPVRQTRFQKCKSWLDERTKGGAVWAEQGQKDAAALGFSETMVFRARDDLHIITDRVGGIASDGKWYWSRDGRPPELPKSSSGADEAAARFAELMKHAKLGDEFVATLSAFLNGGHGGNGRGRRRGSREGGRIEDRGWKIADGGWKIENHRRAGECQLPDGVVLSARHFPNQKKIPMLKS